MCSIKTHTLFNYEHYINCQTIYSKLNSNQIFYFFISTPIKGEKTPREEEFLGRTRLKGHALPPLAYRFRFEV